jgi:hypothetical protein
MGFICYRIDSLFRASCLGLRPKTYKFQAYQA